MRLRQYPLGPYAAASWGHHLRASWGDDLHAPTPDDSSSKSEKAIIELMRDPLKLNSCMQFLCKPDSSSGDRFHPIPSLRHVDSSFYQAEQPFLTTGLHIAVYFGLPNIAQRFISLGTLVDSNDAVQETPLCWAAQHGRDNLVRLLIENGANLNHKDWLGYTPLHLQP
jgi:hypothetical protein